MKGLPPSTTTTLAMSKEQLEQIVHNQLAYFDHHHLNGHEWLIFFLQSKGVEALIQDYLNQKTFRPKKNAPSGSKGAQLQKHIDATLDSGNLREAVGLPPGEDINEWLAVNSKILNTFRGLLQSSEFLYGTLTEFCTATDCPTMTAGPKYEYRWADGVAIKKPIEVSAPKHVEYLIDWIEA
ncbi:unnamed protein product [Dovyalis caffra]|uniref:Uncharacterized protein n=1 Tax=Dovyalis caffra TaxID=77055 RepID=A0AAV1SJW6_9ROSI|nr:unnamed protein product [Dovyalis caffra]